MNKVRKVSKSRTVKKTTMFRKSKSKKYSTIVRISSVNAAKDSVRQLKVEFKSAKTRDKKRHVKMATVLAANRADAVSRKRNLRWGTKTRMKEVSEIYKQAAQDMDLED